MSLKDYFQNILLFILKEPKNFNVENELEKFKIDFDKFGILINPKYNEELFYCLMIYKFLNSYKQINDDNCEPEYYISLLKEFIEQKDLTPIKCLVIVWIMITINDDESDGFRFETLLKIYNFILLKNKNNEIFDKTIMIKKLVFIAIKEYWMIINFL